jgi:hypothetical protein
MIRESGKDGYTLSCDYCGDAADGLFDTFQEAVDYKKDITNGWRSLKDKDGVWNELCPSCNTAEVVRKLKGGGGYGAA